MAKRYTRRRTAGSVSATWTSTVVCAVVFAGVLFAVVVSRSDLHAFEFNQETSCLLLNSDNTDILTMPTDCFDAPEHQAWCLCTKTIFTNRAPGEATGIEQGIVQATEQPGLGNYRVELSEGTLDLSGFAVGDIVGTVTIDELIPEGAGAPPGSFFTVEFEMKVTAVRDGELDFDVRVVDSSVWARVILTYDPTDAEHSDGLTYKGRLTANAPAEGFVFEYRYEGDPEATSPGIEATDQDRPGFNIRYVVAFLGDASAVPAAYTLPAGGDEMEVTDTLRKMTEADGQVANPEEILPLGAVDLCQVVEEPEPCRVIDELVSYGSTGVNNPPEAVINATDPITLEPLVDDAVPIQCGEGRVILRGSNSTDGDGGSQGLTYQWELVDGPEGGALMPEESLTFQDIEVSFLLEGEYTIGLTVDDGQAESNTAYAEVELFAFEDLGPNLPPNLSITTDPDPPTLELVGGSATVHIESNANTGADGCPQTLIYNWEKAAGPDAASFDDPSADDVDVTFTANGEYVIRVTVDDGAPEDNIATDEITVTVGGSSNTFQRCDSNADGTNNVSDAVFTLEFLFSGGDPAVCRESADCNGDADVNLSDPVFDLNFLFAGGPAPALPYPLCDRASSNACASSTQCTP